MGYQYCVVGHLDDVDAEGENGKLIHPMGGQHAVGGNDQLVVDYP